MILHYFCELYVIDYNGAKAARNAGLAPGGTSHRGVAYELRTRDYIKKYISHLEEIIAIEAKLEANQIINETKHIAFQDVRDYLEFNDSGEITVKDLSQMGDEAKAIKRIKVKEAKPGFPHHGNVVEIEFHDKLKGLELLGRNNGAFTERLDITSKGDKIDHAPVNININHRKKGEKLKN